MHARFELAEGFKNRVVGSDGRIGTFGPGPPDGAFCKTGLRAERWGFTENEALPSLTAWTDGYPPEVSEQSDGR